MQLEDGRVLRLAGLEDLALVGSAPSEAAARARAALARRIVGRRIAVQPIAPAADRHGRLLALAAEEGAGWLQQALLLSGAAVVSARAGETGCAAPWLAAEATARGKRLGVWADPQYDVLRAERPETIAAARGRFVLVEGRVGSVRERGAVIYVNFGRRWAEDFTVTILQRNARQFAAAGVEPTRLSGRHIRVRGFVEARGGPWIEVLRPEQIEPAGER
jgi:hypothetical protein